MLLSKECTKCYITKSLDEFYGTRSNCKECVKARQREYNSKHVIEKEVYNKAYRDTHKEQMAQKDFERYWSNPTAARLSALQRYYDNIDNVKATQRRYRQNNSEVLRERNRRRRAILKGLSEHFTELEWQELLETYGAVCMNPECLSTQKLTRDHIVPLISGGSDTIENIQILCMKCNIRKGIATVDYKILHCYNTSVNILI